MSWPCRAMTPVAVAHSVYSHWISHAKTFTTINDKTIITYKTPTKHSMSHIDSSTRVLCSLFDKWKSDISWAIDIEATEYYGVIFLKRPQMHWPGHSSKWRCDWVVSSAHLCANYTRPKQIATINCQVWAFPFCVFVLFIHPLDSVVLEEKNDFLRYNFSAVIFMV